MKKRMMMIMLTGLLLMSAAGCGDKQEAQEKDNKADTETVDQEEEKEEKEKPEKEKPKKEKEEKEKPEKEEPEKEEPEQVKAEQKEPQQEAPEQSEPQLETPKTPESTEPTEPEQTVPEEDTMQIPKSNLVFMGGAMYTHMQNLVTDNYEDGTYDYRDLTEDGMTTIINKSVVNDIQESELYDIPVYVERVVRDYLDYDARDFNIMGAGEQESIKNGFPTYYATWTTGGNEDTKIGTGVFVLTDFYTYFYCFETYADWYYDMEQEFIDVLDGVELVEIG